MTPQSVSSDQAQLDTFLAGADLHLRRTFYPLGFPFKLETNSSSVMQAAAEAWNSFAQTCDDAPVRLCLETAESQTPLSTPKSIFASREHLLSVYGDAENFMLFDFARAFGFGSITQATAADRPLLRYRFLTAALLLVEQRWLAPLHGAFIAKNGAGVLLCGDSMAGKSTLSYACCRDGWTYITDDGMSLVRSRPDLYGVGDYTNLRLREDTRRFFPELANWPAVVRPNGKIAMELQAADLPIATAPGANVNHVVFLERQQQGAASIRPYPEDQALARWALHASLGPLEVRRAQQDGHRRLVKAGVWELRYSSLPEAIAVLEQLSSS
ncbi:MAG TPA: hypothetical protein VKX49_27155 [Bryobacteraceae bacterium]|nr:hypothetical protein [Bryobacteraceae bacterium]